MMQEPKDPNHATITSPEQDNKREKKVIGGSFAISLLVHAFLLLLLGSIIVVPGVVKEMNRITTVAPPPMDVPPAPPMVEPPDVTQDSPGGSPISDVPENATPSSTADSVDALTLASPVNTGPSLNAMPGAATVSVDAFTSGKGGSGGGISGTGIGLGTGTHTLFGSTGKTENALTGKFYDLKQTPGRAPTALGKGGWDPVACAENGKALHKIIYSGFSLSALSKYLSPKLLLYASYIFVPQMDADNAPKAFNVETEVAPSHWVAHYSGLVAPTVDGTYRFTGFADDYLIVGVNDRVVLDGSLPLDWMETKHGQGKSWIASDWRHQHPFYPPPRGRPLNDVLHLVPGDWIDWKADDFKKLDILLGECPGGGFCGYLFIEKQGEHYAKGVNGAPILPVFRIGDVKLSLDGVNPNTYPEFAYGPIFKAKPLPDKPTD